jgi:hypothetical protein
VRRRACALVIGVSSLGLAAIVHAADSTVDDGLLEFLGSVDSDDKNWHDYLAGTDIDKVARGARYVPPPRPATPPPAPAAGTPTNPAAASAPPPVAQP